MSQILQTSNYNEENIKLVRQMIENDIDNPNSDMRAYTMIQNNSSCEFSVSQASREICADALLK